MKRLFLYILLFFSTYTNVQAKQPDEWVVYDRKDTGPTLYINSNGCSVEVDRDGSGLKLYVSDTKTEDVTYDQTITLREVTVGVSKSEIYRVVTIGDSDSDAMRINSRKGYDIFASECVRAARELPYSVKRLFRGLYDIGTPGSLRK